MLVAFRLNEDKETNVYNVAFIVIKRSSFDCLPGQVNPTHTEREERKGKVINMHANGLSDHVFQFQGAAQYGGSYFCRQYGYTMGLKLDASTRIQLTQERIALYVRDVVVLMCRRLPFQHG